VDNLAKDYQNLADVLGTDVNKMMADSILNANNAQAAFLSFAQGINQGTTDSKQFHDAATQIIRILIQQYAGDIPKAKAAFEAYEISLGGTKAAADKLWDSLHGKLAVELANQAVKTLPDAKKALQTFATQGLNDSQTAADNLWKQLTSKLGPQLDGLGNLAAGPAKNKFIDWAVNGLGLTRQHAKDLWAELVTLQQHIDSLHGKDISIVMVGNATYTIKDLGTGTTQAIGTHTAGGRGATGLYVDKGTTSKADDVPIWVSKGEYVVQADAVDQYGVAFMDALNAKKIAMAAGGLVYSAGQQLPSDYNFGLDLESTTESDMQSAELGQMTSSLKSSEAAAKAAAAAAARSSFGGVNASPARTGSIAVEQQYAASLFPRYGWSVPYEMPPLIALWNQESGWNPYAVNPASGAYGIPQSLGHGHPYNLGDYQAQIQWGENYIHGTYGNPGAAEAHELAHNWYAGGGMVPNSGITGMAAMNGGSGYSGGGSTKGWKFPVPTRLHSYDVTDKGYRLGWDAVHGPNGQKPSGYTVETWQLNGKLVDKFIAHATNTAEYGAGGHGLHPAWSYRTFVWANGGPEAPSHAQTITALQKAKTVAGLPVISTTGQDAYQTWFKDYQVLDRDYQQEEAALWALVPFGSGVVGKKGGPTSGQARTWHSELSALQAQQKRAFGVGTKPPGFYDKIKGYYSHPQDLPQSLWGEFIQAVTKLQGMQNKDALGFRFEPDRSNALKHQLARLLADARTLDSAWKGTFSGNLTPGAKRPPPATPIGGGLEDIVPLIIGGPATPVFDIAMGGPSMGFSGGGTIHPYMGGYAGGGQVGLQQVASMFAGVMPTSMLMPSAMPGGISDTLLRRLGTSSSASDEVPRKLSQAGAAHKAAFNVEQLNINNPVAEQPSLSIARASNRMAFLAGRGDS
jgi:hypothetical protein